jgi:stage II sporulation protein D
MKFRREKPFGKAIHKDVPYAGFRISQSDIMVAPIGKQTKRPVILVVWWVLALFANAACGHKAPVKPRVPVAATPGPTTAQPPVQAPPLVTPTVPPPEEIPAQIRNAVPFAPPPEVRGPLVRIGLTLGTEEIRINSPGEFTVMEKVPEAQQKSILGAIQIKVERPQLESGEIYRVQVASLASRDAAEKLGKQLAEKLGQPAVIRENGSNGNCQVRMGKFPTRSEAQEFASGPAVDEGFKDAFVVRELGESTRGEPVLTLRGSDDLFLSNRTGYLLRPNSDTQFLQINGKAYRGMLDIGMRKDGRLLAVNQLGMEEYLFGVVPAELDPDGYPEPAALDAQAIAARTYAMKNLGANRANGFDLTDDASMQVYGGAGIEKQASSSAVRRTAGIAIYYEGNLIDAMYMSTCGGHTEDFSEVFGGKSVPYLVGVFCATEDEVSADPEPNILGSHEFDRVLFADDGSPANRDLELATALGLSGNTPPENPAANPLAAEILRWVERSRTLAGKTGQEGAARELPVTTRAGFLAYAAQQIFGIREIERTVSPADAAYFIGNFSDGSRIPDYARMPIAFLVQRKLWQPSLDNRVKPEESITRADALTLLVRWILAVRPEIMVSGVTADPAAGNPNGPKNNTLAIKRGSRIERLPLAPEVRLFKLSGGRSLPVEQLLLIGNERVSYHRRTNGAIDFLEVELSASGAASDRFSPASHWQVTVTRAVVSEKLRSLAPAVGEIRDLKPARLGSSGRVVQMEIVGSLKSAVVNGYQVRNRLGLRDTLYTLIRNQADDGSVASFTFDGRGWGHGVGMCQTGAVGMARAGRTTEEILKAYYQGIELRKAY